jgi:hypothetical protein
MPKRTLADQLDNMVAALLVSLRPWPEEKPHRSSAPRGDHVTKPAARRFSSNTEETVAQEDSHE